MSLTRRQKQVLDFLRAFLAREGYVPSFQEIAGGLGLSSVATVHKHLATLQAKGYLRRGPGFRRHFELINRESIERRHRRWRANRNRLPLVGRIAAGKPIEAIEARGEISLADLARGRQVFALEVRGDSMIDDHIVEGDYVLVERVPQVENGELVVALVEGSEATLKRFYRERNGLIRLQPANERLRPLLLAADRVEIQGRVIGVLRRY
ncbi:MAG TPA: transcriptional repressor LexA [Terriglobales bacterium]|nr:transcriptional repressor LexA [Terriglobales bacterium]